MPISTVDHLEALLAALSTQDLERLPPAVLQRLADKAYQIHCWAEMVAGQTPFPKVKRNEAPKAGVLADLHNGRRAE